MTPTFYWDFFGPRAEGIAKHFEEHLKEFLVKNNIKNAVTQALLLETNSWSVSCHCDEEYAPLIQKALRPKRSI